MNFSDSGKALVKKREFLEVVRRDPESRVGRNKLVSSIGWSEHQNFFL